MPRASASLHVATVSALRRHRRTVNAPSSEQHTALNNMAVLLLVGCGGVARDEERSVSLLQCAAAFDDAPMARNNLAVCVMYGVGGLTADDAASARTFDALAETRPSTPAAPAAAAVVIVRNHAEAFARMQRLHGFPPAVTSLGILHDSGRGARQDGRWAQVLFRASAGNDGAWDANACTNIGDHHRDIKGMTARDTIETFMWYMRAAEQDWPPAQCWIGIWHAEGRAPLVAANGVMARVWYTKAADQQQHRDTMYKLGSCYERGIGGCSGTRTRR